jgi:hypothetical protein
MQEAQQHVHQQRRPHLPLDGLAAVPEEVRCSVCLICLKKTSIFQRALYRSQMLEAAHSKLFVNLFNSRFTQRR